MIPRDESAGGSTYQQTGIPLPPTSHTTLTGRVVYNRKTHYFTLSDVFRVLGHVNYDTLDFWEIRRALDRLISILSLIFHRFEFLGDLVQGFNRNITTIYRQFVEVVAQYWRDRYWYLNDKQQRAVMDFLIALSHLP